MAPGVSLEEQLKLQFENRPVQIFSTCPQSSVVDRSQYLAQVAEVSRWSEQAGCTGILVYTDNSLVDPWLVAQIVIQSTARLSPLVAIQPVYMHPYSVAKMIATLGYLHGRRLYLNMVAGGFKNDLEALNDSTPHDRRYDRVVEYTNLIRLLLESDRAVSYDGEFYRVRQLKLAPALSPSSSPGCSSQDRRTQALLQRKRSAPQRSDPEPVESYEATPPEPDVPVGVRVGIIARGTEEDAWTVALERFPEDRRGQLAHQLAMKVSDSAWHKQLSNLGDRTDDRQSPYWLHPFKNYKTFCPYLVGSYDVVAKEIARYVETGHRTFILDIPQTQDELQHIGSRFRSRGGGACRGLRDGPAPSTRSLRSGLPPAGCDGGLTQWRQVEL